MSNFADEQNGKVPPDMWWYYEADELRGFVEKYNR